MTSSERSGSAGSRTAAYVVCGLLLALPVWIVLAGAFGSGAGLAGVLTLWLTGIVWLLKRRSEDSSWDRSPPDGRGG